MSDRLQLKRPANAPVASTAESTFTPNVVPTHQPTTVPPVGHDFSRLSIQPKLTVSQPDDPYEQEADRVAGEVIRMSVSTSEVVQNQSETELQRQLLFNSITPLIQRDEAASLPPVMQPSDPANPYPIDLGLRFELLPEFEAMLQQHVDQKLDPSVVETALLQINFNIPSPLPGPINLPTPPTLPPTPPESPVVPRGSGPESPRPGKPEDIPKALAKTREIHAGIESLKKPAVEWGKKTWNNLGPAGKVSTVVSISSATLGFAITDLETFRQVYAPLNGTVISLPGSDWFGFEGNVAGTNITVGLHVDVGKLFLGHLGFKSADFNAIGSPPSPQPLELPGTTVQRSSSLTPAAVDAQAGDTIESQLNQSRNGGNSLPNEVRAFMEPRFGVDLGQVRVHTGSQAIQLNRELNAQAFAYGNDIYFGAGKSPAKDNLTAHELTHVIQQSGANLKPSRLSGEDYQQAEHSIDSTTATDTYSEPDAQTIDISQVPQSKNLVSLRPATEAERLAWSNISQGALFKRLVNNYMDDTGSKITLTQQEMLACDAVIDLTNTERNSTFVNAVESLSKEVSEQKSIAGSIPAVAQAPRTLGNFTVDYEGDLKNFLYTVPYGKHSQKMGWRFTGLARFRDTWDFDPKPFSGSGQAGGSNRSTFGEAITRIADVFLPGKPFDIESQPLPITQGLNEQGIEDPLAVLQPGASQFTPAPAPGVSPPSPPPPIAIQPKLASTDFVQASALEISRVKQADNSYEQEAARIAEQVINMQPMESTIQREVTPEEKEKAITPQRIGDWTRSLPPKDEIPVSKEQQDEIVNSIKRQRESVQDRLMAKGIPGLFSKGKGYEYDGDSHKPDSKPNFTDSDARKTEINELVWQELAGEGSSAAINTYDSQQLTWGRGFAASGQLEAKMEILFQKDPAVKDLLFGAGFTYQGKNWLAVNIASGKIEEGKRALELIRTDVKVLSLLIQIAEDPQHSQNVVDAEFETIKGRAGNVPVWAHNWTDQAIQFAAHCVHWGGSWEQYHNTNGDIKEIARIKAQNAHSTHIEVVRGSGATLIKEGPTATFLSFAKGALRGLVEGPSPLPDNIDAGPSNAIFFKTKSGQYYYLP